MQAKKYEMDMANHTDETKWLLPAYMVDKPHQPKYSQVSKYYFNNKPNKKGQKSKNLKVPKTQYRMGLFEEKAQLLTNHSTWVGKLSFLNLDSLGTHVDRSAQKLMR